MARLALNVDPRGAVVGANQVENALERVEAQAFQTTAATGNLGKSFGGAFGRNVQNASYQIGDFAVQVASGTAASRALAQQLPQLLGGFGVMGAVMGAVAAVGGALVPVLFDLSDGAVDLEDAIDAARDALSDYRDAAETATLSSMELFQQFGYGTGAIREIVNDLARLENMKALNSVRTAIKGVVQDLEDIGDIKDLFDLPGGAQTVATLNQMQQVIRSLRTETDISAMVGHAEDLREEFLAQVGAIDDMNDEQREFLGNLSQAILLMSQLVDTTNTAAVAMADLDPFGGFGEFKYGTASTFRPDREKKQRSGGKSASEKIADDYDTLRKSLDDVYRATRDFEDAQDMLDAALKQGQITQAQYNETLGMARQKFLEATGAAGDLKGVFETVELSFADAFMSMVDGTASAADAFKGMARTVIAELYKVLVVQRLVGSFNPDTGIGTGIVGALAGFGGFRADGGPVTAGTPYMVGERGPELFVPKQSGAIVPNGQAQAVNISYHFQGGVTPADLERAVPVLVEKTKATVIDAVQRGGAIARVMR